jgi:hypothetical protein
VGPVWLIAVTTLTSPETQLVGFTHKWVARHTTVLPGHTLHVAHTRPAHVPPGAEYVARTALRHTQRNAPHGMPPADGGDAGEASGTPASHPPAALAGRLRRAAAERLQRLLADAGPSAAALATPATPAAQVGPAGPANPPDSGPSPGGPKARVSPLAMCAAALWTLAGVRAGGGGADSAWARDGGVESAFPSCASQLALADGYHGMWYHVERS